MKTLPVPQFRIKQVELIQSAAIQIVEIMFEEKLNEANVVHSPFAPRIDDISKYLWN